MNVKVIAAAEAKWVAASASRKRSRHWLPPIPVTEKDCS